MGGTRTRKTAGGVLKGQKSPASHVQGRRDPNESDSRLSSPPDSPLQQDAPPNGATQPLQFPRDAIFKTDKITVQGHTLPFVGEHEPQPDAYGGPELTSWALYNMSPNISGSIGKIKKDYPQIQRYLHVRKVTTRAGDEQPYTLNLKRGQNADAAWYQLYGAECERTESCDRCQKGNGPFEGCVTLDNGPCGNCRYNAGAKKCSFCVDAAPESETTGLKRSGLVAHGRVQKGMKMADDLVEKCRTIPPVHLRKMSTVLSEIADMIEDGEFE